MIKSFFTSKYDSIKVKIFSLLGIFLLIFFLYGCSASKEVIVSVSEDPSSANQSIENPNPENQSIENQSTENQNTESQNIKNPAPTEINILFTSDLHSHFETFEENGSFIGGYARLKTLANQNGLGSENTIFLDCGDFTTGLSVTGSPYSQFYRSDAAEYRMLGKLGTMYTTFGNHELDFNVTGLIQMSSAAIDSGDFVPPFLVCNIDWSSIEGTYPELKKNFEKLGYKKYDIINISDKRIAIVGVMGGDAIQWASDYNDLKFFDPIASVRSTVDEIKAAGGADMYILLAHGGTNRALLGNINNDEIYQILDVSPEFDVVVCGHTHSTFDEKISYGKSTLIACGCYSRNLGRLELIENKENQGTDTVSWSVTNYKILPVTSDIEEDTGILEFISTFKSRLQ